MSTLSPLDLKRGLVAKCDILEVYDGDTVTVELRIPLRVRLLECWAPEIRTRDPVEKLHGEASRDHLRSIALNKEGLIHVPWEDAKRVDNVFTFGRVLAHIWVDGVSLSEQQVAQKHATLYK